jgi:hypothetical protein
MELGLSKSNIQNPPIRQSINSTSNSAEAIPFQVLTTLRQSPARDYHTSVAPKHETKDLSPTERSCLSYVLNEVRRSLFIHPDSMDSINTMEANVLEEEIASNNDRKIYAVTSGGMNSYLPKNSSAEKGGEVFALRWPPITYSL